MRPLTPNSGSNFWDGRYLGAVVESALRSRRLTSKELGHVIMCAYGARERESSTGGCHAERLVMPSGRLMAFVVAAQERPGVRAARHNQRPRGTPPALHDTGRALRTRTGSSPALQQESG